MSLQSRYFPYLMGVTDLDTDCVSSVIIYKHRTYLIDYVVTSIRLLERLINVQHLEGQDSLVGGFSVVFY